MTVTLLHDVARGMAYMHAAGYRHNDVKSHNVLLISSPGRTPLPLAAKLADFGLSYKTMVLEGDANVARICGTVTHLAPEVYAAHGSKPAPGAATATGGTHISAFASCQILIRKLCGNQRSFF